MNIKKGLPILFVSAGAMLAAAIIRFFQYVTVFDRETGFFIPGSEAAVTLLRGFIIAFILLFSVLCFAGAKKEWTALTVASDGFGEKVSLYLGIVYIAAAVIQIWETVTDAAGAMFWVSAAQALIYAVTGLLMMKNTVIPAAAGYIQILASLCFFFRSLDRFDSDLIIRSHSDTLITLLALVFGAAFFSASARCYSRLEAKGTRKKELIYAGIAFLFSGIHVLPKLTALITGSAAGISAPDKSVCCLFLVTGGFLCALCLTEQNKSIDYLIPEDEKGEDKKKGKKSEA